MVNTKFPIMYTCNGQTYMKCTIYIVKVFPSYKHYILNFECHVKLNYLLCADECHSLSCRQTINRTGMVAKLVDGVHSHDTR